MFNGIGLATTKGSSTNGYVVRNLSHLRPRDGPPGGRPGEFGSGFGGPDDGPPIHRQPDQGILDHERKRKVEVRCMELRDALEDKGVDEDTIEEQVAALRARLIAQTTTTSHSDIRQLKSSDTHGRAAAKQAEMNKMGRALGINAGYVEGNAFNRKDAEMERIEKAQRREESERRHAENLLKKEKERERREAEFKEQERLRRRQEYYARLEAEKIPAKTTKGILFLGFCSFPVAQPTAAPPSDGIAFTFFASSSQPSPGVKVTLTSA
ncbi:hypothetical protein QFC19_003980 [Naganishia cerealis]|uniref:Uncharacterized protein n=1 Tax=Naganishia cerealis TaxID=610337 RepID=A0ACC2VYP6_9TREE|nr:hypothetical protein QFC19_003980 [Naganishia cerealis]